MTTLAYDQATGALDWDTTRTGAYSCCLAGNGVVVSPDSTRVAVIGVAGEFPVGIITAVYDDESGAEDWAKTCDGPENLNANPRAIAFSPNGKRIFVGGVEFSESDDYGFATLAYGAGGGRLVWAKIYRGFAGPRSLNGLAVSPDGSRVVVTGEVQIGDSGLDTDFATVAYAASSGERRWARR
jgi:DNA-binding beta-propeller fold protein YncE